MVYQASTDIPFVQPLAGVSDREKQSLLPVLDAQRADMHPLCHNVDFPRKIPAQWQTTEHRKSEV